MLYCYDMSGYGILIYGTGTGYPGIQKYHSMSACVSTVSILYGYFYMIIMPWTNSLLFEGFVLVCGVCYTRVLICVQTEEKEGQCDL